MTTRLYNKANIFFSLNFLHNDKNTEFCMYLLYDLFVHHGFEYRASKSTNGL